VRFLTDFADQAVVLPVMLLVALALALLGWRRGALAWVVGVGGTLGVMLLLKLLFSACGDLLPDIAIHSPSGHTAAAAVTYGGLVVLLGASGGTVLATALGVAVVFGFSRVVLGFHTPPEVLLGGVVGLMGVALLVRLAGPPPAVGRRRNIGLVAACLVGLLLFHGAHVRAETAIGRFARLLEVWPLAACKADVTGAG
jgi:membrane-associated phospholipid phosphatase